MRELFSSVVWEIIFSIAIIVILQFTILYLLKRFLLKEKD